MYVLKESEREYYNVCVRERQLRGSIETKEIIHIACCY